MWLIDRKINIIQSGVLHGMVDIHSHLMWGVDDGSKNMEHTKQMITTMQEMGIKSAFVTPHIMSDLTENTTLKLSERFEKEILPIANSMGFEMWLAGEYMLDEAFLQKLQQDTLLTYDNKHILVEISTTALPVNFEETIFEICSRGYIPVLAHPERYPFHEMSKYERLKDMGCKFQLNILSLSDYYGKHIRLKAEKMLDEQMYNFLGTDVHSMNMIKAISQIRIFKCMLEQIEELKSKNDMLVNISKETADGLQKDSEHI